MCSVCTENHRNVSAKARHCGSAVFVPLPNIIFINLDIRQTTLYYMKLTLGLRGLVSIASYHFSICENVHIVLDSSGILHRPDSEPISFSCEAKLCIMCLSDDVDVDLCLISVT